MFVQRLMFAWKGKSSARVIPREEENFYTIKNKGSLRAGFLTKQENRVNSKKNTSFLEINIHLTMGKKADWERSNICHVPEGKSWWTTIMKIHKCTRKQKQHVMKKIWKAWMFLIQIRIYFLLTRKISSETFLLGLSFTMCCRRSKPFIWVPMKLEHRKVNYCRDRSKPAFKPVAAGQRSLTS